MKKIILAGLLAFGFTASAVASEDGSGTYIGLAYGNTTFADGSYQGTLKDDKDNGYKIYGGYQFNKIVGVEATYTDYGDYSYTYTNSNLSPTAISLGANLGYTFLQGQLRPFALVGLSYLDLGQSGNDIFDKDNTYAYNYGVGIEYSPKILNGVGFRAMWNTDIYIVDSRTTSDNYAQGFGMFSAAIQYKF